MHYLMDQEIDSQTDRATYDPQIMPAYLWPLGPRSAGNWNRLSLSMLAVHRHAMMSFFICIVPLTVLTMGTAAATVGANTVASLFILEIDTFAYDHLLDFETKSRYESLAKVTLSPAQHREVYSLNRSGMAIGLVTMALGIVSTPLFHYKDWCHMTSSFACPLLAYVEARTALERRGSLTISSSLRLAARLFGGMYFYLYAVVIISTMTLNQGPLPLVSRNEYVHLGNSFNDVLNFANWDP